MTQMQQAIFDIVKEIVDVKVMDKRHPASASINEITNAVMVEVKVE